MWQNSNMKEIIAFAGSNSKNSINKQLVELAVSKLKKTKYKILDLNDFQLPFFGVDYEKEYGYPENVLKFDKLISATDGIILSLAEHNGSYTAVFKNLFDWLSRVDSKTWKGKPMLLLSTSTGSRGGRSVMEAAKSRFPFHGSNIIATFSLPNFDDNFGKGRIDDNELNSEFLKAISRFEEALNK